MPRFSIIIPAYNAEAYLSRCLDSILSQSCTDYEVIVINDGSTDGTAVLLEQEVATHNNLHVITQSNCGMATARNRGLQEATGEYILFVDSDDRLCPDALASLTTHINGEDIVGFGTQIYNEKDCTYTDNPAIPNTAIPGWDYFCRERLIARPVHFVCIWQRTYRRTFLEEQHLRFIDGMRRAEDDLFSTMVMLNAKSVKTIADCLYVYHVRQGSITRSDNPILRADALRAQSILAETFIPLQGIDKRTIYQVLASNYINHLAHKGNKLTVSEWHNFHEVCITPRHRMLYCLCRINPALMRLYNRLCSSLH